MSYSGVASSLRECANPHTGSEINSASLSRPSEATVEEKCVVEMGKNIK